jgi:hypothetical protein
MVDVLDRIVAEPEGEGNDGVESGIGAIPLGDKIAAAAAMAKLYQVRSVLRAPAAPAAPPAAGMKAMSSASGTAQGDGGTATVDADAVKRERAAALMSMLSRLAENKALMASMERIGSTAADRDRQERSAETNDTMLSPRGRSRMLLESAVVESPIGKNPFTFSSRTRRYSGKRGLQTPQGSADYTTKNRRAQAVAMSVRLGVQVEGTPENIVQAAKAVSGDEDSTDTECPSFSHALDK